MTWSPWTWAFLSSNQAKIPFKAKQPEKTYILKNRCTYFILWRGQHGQPTMWSLSLMMSIRPMWIPLGPLLESHERFPERVNATMILCGVWLTVKKFVYVFTNVERAKLRPCGKPGACGAVAVGILKAYWLKMWKFVYRAVTYTLVGKAR